MNILGFPGRWRRGTMSCTLEKGFPCNATAQPKQLSLGLSLDSGEAGCLKEVETGEDKVDMLLDGNDHVGKPGLPGPDTIKRLGKPCTPRPK